MTNGNEYVIVINVDKMKITRQGRKRVEGIETNYLVSIIRCVNDAMKRVLGGGPLFTNYELQQVVAINLCSRESERRFSALEVNSFINSNRSYVDNLLAATFNKLAQHSKTKLPQDIRRLIASKRQIAQIRQSAKRENAESVAGCSDEIQAAFSPTQPLAASGVSDAAKHCPPTGYMPFGNSTKGMDPPCNEESVLQH